MNRLFIYIYFVLALIATGCGSDAMTAPEEPVDDGTAVVSLNIGLADALGEFRTRDAVVDDENYFEDPESEYEKIKSLRIIIVDAAGNVEHNRYIPLQTTSTLVRSVFRVKKLERKQIYLFANELPKSEWNGNGYYGFESLVTGDPFPSEAVAGLTLEADENGVLFDNTGASGTYIPLNEHFEVTLTKDEPGDENNPSETFNLFVTRAAVKFTFSIDPKSEVGSSTYKVEEIHFSRVGGKEYLLPNGTVYDPGKYLTSGFPKNGRFITEYSLPSEAGGKPYRFNPESFGKGADDGVARSDRYSPYIYFAESKPETGGYYEVSLKVKRDDDDKVFDFGPVRLPNLPDFPRNTHVKVNFRFNSYGLECAVVLVPYIGVWLNPIFGIDPDGEGGENAGD